MDITYMVALPFIIASFLCSLFIILICVKNKSLRKGHPYRFVYFLAIFEFFYFLTYLFPISYFNSDAICKIQAFLNEMFSLSSLAWTAYMTFEIFNIAYRKMPVLCYGYKYPLLIVIFFSLVIAAIPFTIDAYGESGNWCWIKKPSDYKIYIYLTFRIVLYYIFIVWNATASCITYNKKSQGYSEEKKAVFNKLRFYPIILCILQMPFSIYRFFPDINLYFQIFATCAFVSSGFCNLIVYGSSEKVRETIADMNCFKKKEPEDNLINNSKL